MFIQGSIQSLLNWGGIWYFIFKNKTLILFSSANKHGVLLNDRVIWLGGFSNFI